jgi:hypothetical protein
LAEALRGASRARACDGKAIATKRAKAVAATQLALHYRQLRVSRGTVLLGDPPKGRAAPLLDRAWFVNDCPLDANDAVDVIRKRHGFTSRTATLRALRKARDELRKAKHRDAAVLEDLP